MTPPPQAALPVLPPTPTPATSSPMTTPTSAADDDDGGSGNADGSGLHCTAHSECLSSQYCDVATGCTSCHICLGSASWDRTGCLARCGAAAGTPATDVATTATTSTPMVNISGTPGSHGNEVSSNSVSILLVMLILVLLAAGVVIAAARVRRRQTHQLLSPQRDRLNTQLADFSPRELSVVQSLLESMTGTGKLGEPPDHPMASAATATPTISDPVLLKGPTVAVRAGVPGNMSLCQEQQYENIGNLSLGHELTEHQYENIGNLSLGHEHQYENVGIFCLESIVNEQSRGALATVLNFANCTDLGESAVDASTAYASPSDLCPPGPEVTSDKAVGNPQPTDDDVNVYRAGLLYADVDDDPVDRPSAAGCVPAPEIPAHDHNLNGARAEAAAMEMAQIYSAAAGHSGNSIGFDAQPTGQITLGSFVAGTQGATEHKVLPKMTRSSSYGNALDTGGGGCADPEVPINLLCDPVQATYTGRAPAQGEVDDRCRATVTGHATGDDAFTAVANFNAGTDGAHDDPAAHRSAGGDSDMATAVYSIVQDDWIGAPGTSSAAMAPIIVYDSLGGDVKAPTAIYNIVQDDWIGAPGTSSAAPIIVYESLGGDAKAPAELEAAET